MAINFLSHTLGFQSNEPEEGQRAFPGGTGAPLWEAGRGHKFDPWLGNLCSCVLHVQPKKKEEKRWILGSCWKEKRECQAQRRGHLQNCICSLLPFLELSMAPALDEWVSRALHCTWSDLSGQANWTVGGTLPNQSQLGSP